MNDFVDLRMGAGQSDFPPPEKNGSHTACFTTGEIQALNIIRWISTFSIVACHFFQGYGNPWAWVLNIGVQIFFFLSGFLYGYKGIGSCKKFYSGRVIKIYIPYVVWVTIAIGLSALFSSSHLSVGAVADQYFCLSNMEGFEHLWFIPVILLCYLTLPLFARMSNRSLILASFLLLAICCLLLSFKYHPYLVWVSVYYVGYFAGRFPKMQKYLAVFSLFIACVLAYGFPLEGYSMHSLRNYSIHAFGAISIFLILFLSLRSYVFNIQIFNMRGGYSMYLAHHIFLLGPLSVLFLTPHRWLNLSIAIILIVSFTFITDWVSNFLIRKIKPIFA